jgi:hypothetical protein
MASSHVASGVVLVIFAAQITGGEPLAGHETQAVGFFAPHALPELAFEQNRQIIGDWLRRKDR